MEMTREEAIRNFREHWASNTITGVDKYHKGEYLTRHGFTDIRNRCFLCEFAQNDHKKSLDCGKCPIEWPKTDIMGFEPCMKSYYGQWVSAVTPEERKRFAAIIRDLPEKKEEAEPKFKPGDKVVPVSKPRAWESLDQYKNCGCSIPDFLKENGFLFIIRLYDETAVLSNSPSSDCGDTFYISDLRPYAEPKEKTLAGFKIGDRVIVVANDESIYKGKIGTVKSLSSPSGYNIGIEFDENVGGHDLWNSRDGIRYKDGHGLWKRPECLQHYTEPEVKPEPVCKFKVGDIIKGNALSKLCYYYTNSDMTKGEVIALQDGGKILIKILEHKCITHIDNTIYDVEEKYFDLVDEPKEEAKPINHCPQDKATSGHGVTLPDFIHVSIKIIHNGPATICVLSYDGKQFKGTAKCNPADTYDEATGQIIACERAAIELSKYRIAQAAR